MHRSLLVMMGLAVVAAGGLAAQSPPERRVDVPVAGHTVQVPAGFTVEVYAESLPNARWVALGPDGVPYLSQPRRGRVVKLPDLNHDGRADTVITVLDSLNRPHGLAFRGDTLYVAETGRVIRLAPGAARPQVVLDSLFTGGNHWTKTIAFGPDGRLYIAGGSSCNVCTESDQRRATVMRVNQDGTGFEIFARGLRNSVGIAFHPTTGELWGTNNDRDMLGDDVPPERINIIKQGRFYGWPRCWLPAQKNPEFPDADCSDVEPPAITFQAHSAPLGITFYEATAAAPPAFPAEYRGDALIAYHGSWNRSVPTGYKLVRVRVVNGRPVSVGDFITGFRPEGESAWARPVATLVMPDGSLLFTDDSGGRVFRVRYVGN